MKKQSASPLIRAVIYARYSSSGQREESIEGQLRECHEFARRNGFTVVGEYVDKALTGRTDKRPDFQRMLRDSERGVFEAVICWKTDRFARNRYDSAMYKYKLKRCGVRLFYAKETIPEGPEGIILESVMEGYAEYYSENLSQNVKRGYYDSALELKTLGQTVIGLRKGPDGRFEIDPATAPIVRRIFEEYAAGEKAKDIYTRLNAEGYRTSRGGLFNKNSLRRILTNEKYVGVYEFRDIRVEDGIPALVSHDLFEQCGRMLKVHRRSPAAKRDTSFLLTTKIFCGECGEPMTGDAGTSKSGTVHYYYICNKRRRHKCKKERVKKDSIEQAVVEELVRLVHSDDFIEKVADLAMEYQEKEKDNSALRALEVYQKEIEKKIENMMRAIEAGVVTASTKTRLMQLEAELADVERGIAKELISTPELDRDQIVFFLEQFRDGDIEDETYRAFLVDTFLQAVYVYDDRLVITLNYSGENNTVTKELADKAASGGGAVCSCSEPSSALQIRHRLSGVFFVL
ncbi:MAG: recombinase family protein [Stomatobaculum sp.]